jgi:hypothetical protein
MTRRTEPLRDVSTPPRRPDWRSEVVGASGLNIIAGIWLIISPWVLGFNSGDSYWNPIICGIIVGVIGLIRAGGAYRASELSWINALVGVWLFISAWWLASSNQAIWNDLVLGVIVFVLALISATASEEGHRHHPGGPPIDTTA